jgi:hypothetical protein
VAQKLHACTGPQRQDRARDILDILVVDMLGQLDRVRVRAATERICGERNTHRFPPETNIPPEWHIDLETLAAELGLPYDESGRNSKRIYEFSRGNRQRLSHVVLNDFRLQRSSSATSLLGTQAESAEKGLCRVKAVCHFELSR